MAPFLVWLMRAPMMVCVPGGHRDGGQPHGAGRAHGRDRRAALLRLHRPLRRHVARRLPGAPVGQHRFCSPCTISMGWAWQQEPLRISPGDEPDMHPRAVASEETEALGAPTAEGEHSDPVKHAPETQDGLCSEALLGWGWHV